jgi:hypothetical protein
MTDYAIVVGINRYPGISSLRGPENDARAFRDWLVSPKGGGLPPDNPKQLQFILSSDYPEPDAPRRAKPTLELVEDAFYELFMAAYRGKVGRRLYVFLAGHGFAPSFGFAPGLDESALLMANAEKQALGYHIPGGVYVDWFRAAAAFDEILLFMDCCRDDYSRTAPHLPPFAEVKRPEAANVRYFYAYATKWSYKAREKEFVPGECRGLFSYALLEGLNGAAANSDGKITGQSLANYIFNRLPSLTPEKPQEPRFDFEPQRDIVIVENVVAAKPNVHITFTPPDEDAHVELFGPDRQVIDRWRIKDGPWTRALDRGLYKLQVPGTARSHLFEVPGGEEVRVEFR